jgi:4-hydroxy-tetrahydrodipicolinate synthase
MIQGSIVALVTPMGADGSVDFNQLAELVEWHIQEGTDAIVAVGTTGESATLDFEEHVAVIRRVLDAARKRVPIIAGTGANSTREALALTQAAREARADACLLVTPYYNRPPQEGLFQHYRAIAKSVPIPLILYNVPGRTGCDLLPATVARIAALPGVIGIKEAKGEVGRFRALLELGLKDFDVYSGDDAIACEGLLLGCKGNISVTANVAPRLMHELCVAAMGGDSTLAHELDRRLAPLNKALFLDPNPIPVKWALGQMRAMPQGIRLPLVALSAEHHAAVHNALQLAGALA